LGGRDLRQPAIGTPVAEAACVCALDPCSPQAGQRLLCCRPVSVAARQLALSASKGWLADPVKGVGRLIVSSRGSFMSRGLSVMIDVNQRHATDTRPSKVNVH
jgi:hypothetical protein